MQTFSSIDLHGKKVLVRTDFNVPLDEDRNVTDNTRIKAALPTMKHIISNGGSLILMSHLGRPKGFDQGLSLAHIIPELEKVLGTKVLFNKMNNEKEASDLCSGLRPGEVMLLENLRFDAREKKGDEKFAEFLAGLADIYVNDAFGTAHRAHASTAVIVKFAKQASFGFLMEQEIENLNKVLNNSSKPVTAIIGGAKVSSKIDVIYNLLGKIDNLIIGGGMAYTFVKAKGGKIGNSLFEEDKMGEALEIFDLARDKNVNIHLPVDSIVADEFSNDANIATMDISTIPDELMGLDIGPDSIILFNDVILNSKTILWNGPMGVFEMANFEKGTIEIAKSIVEATKEGAFSLVGGGDSVAALKKFDLSDKVSYVSTGGGAMLEFMEGKELPGIKAMRS